VQLDGTHQQIQTIVHPGYPDPAMGGRAVALPSGRVEIASELNQPKLREAMGSSCTDEGEGRGTKDQGTDLGPGTRDGPSTKHQAPSTSLEQRVQRDAGGHGDVQRINAVRDRDSDADVGQAFDGG
jgi:hypothetical protein